MQDHHAVALPPILDPASPPEFPPLETAVTVTMPDGTEFRAMRIWVETEDDGCPAWATADEHEPLAPTCWDDGVCWGSNGAGVESIKPIAWRPINTNG